MDTKNFLTPRRVIGGVFGAIAIAQAVSRVRRPALAGEGDGSADLPAPGSGGRPLQTLGVLAVTAALALPAYRRIASARAASWLRPASCQGSCRASGSR